MRREAVTILFCGQGVDEEASRVQHALDNAGLVYNWLDSSAATEFESEKVDVILLSSAEPALDPPLAKSNDSNRTPIVQLLHGGSAVLPGVDVSLHIDQLQRLATALLYATEPNRLKRACAQASAALIESEERFRRLFEDSVLPSVIISEGTITAANVASAKLLGASKPADLLGMSPMELSPEFQPCGGRSEELVEEAIAITMSAGAHHFEWETLRLDHSHIHVRVNTTLLNIDNKPVIHSVFEDISIERDQRQRLEFLAYHDPITGLLDRNASILNIDQRLKQNPNTSVAVLKLGLDDFKSINNLFGYHLADKLLVLVKERLAAGIPIEHELYRMPGGKFAIFLPNIECTQALKRAAEAVLMLFEQPFDIDDFSRRLQITIGASLTESRTIDAQTLLQESQIALSEAQKNRALRYCLFEPAMRTDRDNKMRLRDQMRQALNDGQFEMYYQPQMELRSKRVTGAESLIRWNHPTRGTISPCEFIPIAEESGLIVPITRWILKTVCQQGVIWLERGWEEFTLAVNLSAEHFDEGTVETDINLALEESGLPPQHLEIELTESTLLNRTDELIVLLERLRQREIKLAIDDFGTGYSNLSYLAQLPVQKLKIDQSFIADYFTNKGNRSVVQATVLLAKSLKLKTIAEGVEKPMIADSLYAIGCDAVQGYLLSKPMPARDFEFWLEAHKAEQRQTVFQADDGQFPNP